MFIRDCLKYEFEIFNVEKRKRCLIRVCNMGFKIHSSKVECYFARADVNKRGNDLEMHWLKNQEGKYFITIKKLMVNKIY